MKIEPKQIKIREVFDGYADQGDDGVFAYGGRLAIRPPYQREFVYDNDQAESVIQTVLKGFPLNVMYWVKAMTNTPELNQRMIERGQHPVFGTDTQTVLEEIGYHLDEAHTDLYLSLIHI